MLLLVFGAVAFVLLIACVNVATLMLAWGSTVNGRFPFAPRSVQRSLDWFVKSSSRNVSIAVFGGGLGLILSAISIKAMALLIPRQSSRRRRS